MAAGTLARTYAHQKPFTVDYRGGGGNPLRLLLLLLLRLLRRAFTSETASRLPAPSQAAPRPPDLRRAGARRFLVVEGWPRHAPRVGRLRAKWPVWRTAGAAPCWGKRPTYDCPTQVTNKDDGNIRGGVAFKATDTSLVPVNTLGVDTDAWCLTEFTVPNALKAFLTSSSGAITG